KSDVRRHSPVTEKWDWGRVMQARDCFNCGRPAEPPFSIAALRLLPPELILEAESLGIFIETDRVYCCDCLDQLPEDERAEKALDEEIRSGSRCYIWCEELDYSGGTAVRLNGTFRRLLPRHAKCSLRP